MTNARIVFLHGLPLPLVEIIVAASPPGFATTAIDGKTAQDKQVEAVSEADFLIVYRARLTEEMLRAARRLKLVQLLAAGYDGMDLNLLQELAIPCANNGGANSWAVADQTILMMLALYRRVLSIDGDVRQGRWAAGINGLNTFELANKVVGVLGLGNIGRKVARRAQAFDAVVQYHSRNPLPVEQERELNVKHVGLEELFRTSDVLTLHAPLTEETRHIVNRKRLSTMKRTALIINTSRGALIDENALAEALADNRLAGAGIDAFETEPVDSGNPLLSLSNVVLSPHSGGTTSDTWLRRAQFAFQNITRVCYGQPPESIVTNYDGQGGAHPVAPRIAQNSAA